MAAVCCSTSLEAVYGGTSLNEIIIQILVELLSTPALTTKETKQGKPSEFIVREGIYYLTYE